MSNLKYRLAIIFCIISINFVGCAINSTEANKQVERIETSINPSNNVSVSKDSSDLLANSECKSLFDLSQKVYNTEIDPSDGISFTEQYLTDLQNYIKNNKDIDCINDNYGINIITSNHSNNNYLFNLIRYDGNSVGLGTLERTWTFLQVIGDDNIDSYILFDKSAEYPLYIKILELLDEKLIISIAGVTNVSRSNTAFISFWEYSPDGLKEYTSITLNSNYKNDNLNGNEYYIEYFNDNSVQITNVDEKLAFYNIAGINFKVSSILQNDTVIIETINLK